MAHVFSPPLNQDLAIVVGHRNTGPHPDHPFKNNLRGLPGPSVPWDHYSGRLISVFLGALLLEGRGALKLKRVQH